MVLGNQQSCSPCKYGWTTFAIQGTKQCFKYIGEKTISSAESGCNAVNGILPVPENSLQNADYFNAFVKVKGQVHNVALGINDVKNEGEFVRANGQKVTFFNWYFAEPNNWNGNEDHVGKISYFLKFENH